MTLLLVDTQLGHLALAQSEQLKVARVGVPIESTAAAPQDMAAQLNRRPKVGLVLSGGGARGAAHVGVIKVLEELRVPIDFIAGTSMGAIVGGLYASGMSSDQIQAVVTTLDWADAFQDQIDREDRSFRRKRDDDLYLVKAQAGFNRGEITLPTGILAGQKVDLMLKSLTLPASNISDFDELSIPFRALGTDIVTGEPVVLDSGDLAMAIRASMSIPAFFAPVNVDGKLLVDGGIANNLPVDVARDMGADVIIAVDISTPLLDREQLQSVIDVTGQLTGLLTRRNTEAQIDALTGEDLLILPDLGDITAGDFGRAEEAIPIGEAAMREYRDQLRRLAMSASEYDDFLASRRVPKASPPVIDFLRIENRSRLGDEVLAAGLDIPLGRPLDVAALERDIGQIYGWQIFQNVRYEIVEEGQETGVVLHVDERPWGPNYLQFGLALSDNFDGDNFFNLAVAYTRTGMNALGGELRTAAAIGQEPALGLEVYQPLDAGSRFFIHPRAL
jgi:NTE family protein